MSPSISGNSGPAPWRTYSCSTCWDRQRVAGSGCSFSRSVSGWFRPRSARGVRASRCWAVGLSTSRLLWQPVRLLLPRVAPRRVRQSVKHPHHVFPFPSLCSDLPDDLRQFHVLNDVRHSLALMRTSVTLIAHSQLSSRQDAAI